MGWSRESSSDEITRYYVIATGSRPKIYIEGSTGIEHAITSDDVFSIPHQPKRVFLIGGGFVASEIASFFRCLGSEVTMAINAPVLRGKIALKTAFDEEMVNILQTKLQKKGGFLLENEFFKSINISRVDLDGDSVDEDGEIRVHRSKYIVDISYLRDTIQPMKGEYDLVINCIGRTPVTDGMGLDKIEGLRVSKGKYIEGMNHGIPELTGNPRYFAVGDVLKGSARNNPAAEFGGKRVSRMIRDLIELENSEEGRTLPDTPEMAQPKSYRTTPQMYKGMPLDTTNRSVNDGSQSVEEIYKKYAGFDYSKMPYTIFTHPQLSGCGLTQQQAIREYGEENVRCVTVKKRSLHRDFLQSVLSRAGEEVDDGNYYKVISRMDDERIVGMHFIGDHGEDTMYGLYLSMSKGITRHDIAHSFIIHPSMSETFADASIHNTSTDIDTC